MHLEEVRILNSFRLHGNSEINDKKADKERIVHTRNYSKKARRSLRDRP